MHKVSDQFVSVYKFSVTRCVIDYDIGPVVECYRSNY